MNEAPLALSAASMLSLLALAGPGTAQQLEEVQRIQVPPSVFLQRSLAGSGAVLVAQANTGYGTPARVRVYVRSARGLWSDADELASPWDPTEPDFGDGLDVSGNTIVVGSPGEGTGGTAHVFRRAPGTNDWVFEASLLPDDGAVGDSFGYSAAIAGNTIAIGALGHEHPGEVKGAVYLFQRTPGPAGAWSQTQELHMPPPGQWFTGGFAHDLDIDGGFLAVAAFGEAHVYRRTGGAWSYADELLESGTYSFGDSIAISKDVVVVGDSRYPSPSPFGTGGSAHVYQPEGPPTNWEKQLRMRPVSGYLFGVHVAAEGEYVATTDEGSPEISQELQVFRREGAFGWRKVAVHYTSGQEPSALAFGGRDIVVVNNEWGSPWFLSVFRLQEGPGKLPATGGPAWAGSR